ncbi:MAG: hypothetical protein SFU98_07185 [Leptospiraceae bacterium]|nr:hypothetical protein [Leptospiraceae bacterium]
MNFKLINKLFQIETRLLVLLLSLISNCIANPSINGPNVIRKSEADDRFERIFISKAILEFKVSSGELSLKFLSGRKESSDVLEPLKVYCLRNVYYYTDAVDYCEKVLLNIQAKSYDEFNTQFELIKNNVCKLQTAVMFTNKRPLEGELHLCSLVGAEERK